MQWSLGSRWLRWDPHLHAPGTLRNNQFGDDWESYLQVVEAAHPAAAALGITDYFSLRTYKRVVEFRAAGRISALALVFPNVELRLTIETRSRKAINLHMLVSPNDPDHVARAEGVLSRLRWPFRDETYQCTEPDLVRLGRTFRSESTLDYAAALSIGANQFKVSWQDLQTLRDEDLWIQNNILFAVAAGEDGLSGLQGDASFTAERENLGRFADIIFSAAVGDREYWAGNHAGFVAAGHRPKPCLHGSDAHEVAKVLRPDQDRRCWIRAEPTWHGLRQTLIEPLRRVQIGAEAPPGPSPDRVISVVRISGAPWMKTTEVRLNPGLVTVIGSKGSGKTALADMASLGADAKDADPGPASFFKKAEKLLSGLEVELEWGDGSKSSGRLPHGGSVRAARVRYLSQQFVERLCGSSSVSEPLSEEIEAVVFSAIPQEQRSGATTFAQLRDRRMRGVSAEVTHVRSNIMNRTKEISEARAEHERIPAIKADLEKCERERSGVESAIKALPVARNMAAAAEHQGLSTKLAKLREAVAEEKTREASVADLRGELRRAEADMQEAHDQRMLDFAGVGLSAADWEVLRPKFDPTWEQALSRRETAVTARVQALQRFGISASPIAGVDAEGLAELVAKEKKVAELLGLDDANAKRLAKLNLDLPVHLKAEQQARDRLVNAEGAKERIRVAREARLDLYESLFKSIGDQERILQDLYAPLSNELGSQGQLSFAVRRVVDLDSWATSGERLLDLRSGPFPGRGALLGYAREALLPAWERGTPAEARAALEELLDSYGSAMAGTLRAGVTFLDLGTWMFSTNHIQVKYDLSYQGAALERLSPGTRGVVLLTLFLKLDKWDERPLIIDQPEENLDPKSVFTELVPFFREAALRRQIVMVTHNANLVVNTDSDQVIVATSVRVAADTLPNVTYVAGALEDPAIRDQVCLLLEGGEEAFRKRGQRYGVRVG